MDTKQGLLMHITNGPPLYPGEKKNRCLTVLNTVLDCSTSLWQLWKKVMEVMVKIEKTNTMTNTWGKTKTKTSIAENED